MTVLVTGAAGFIGMHVAAQLLERGERVLGVDNLSDYYDVGLKKARLAHLGGRPEFRFVRGDIAEAGDLEAALGEVPDVDRIVHLAAQAGVRYSLTNPAAYARANLTGHFNLLELARELGDGLGHFVYASSSSVYGGNTKHPFSVDDRVDRPISLYAATKRADEVMSYAYSHMFGLPMTGLRFFSVYGSWGRPDMSAYIFTSKILADEPIPVFNHGDMSRDFTYIDDVVAGVLAALDRPPAASDATGGAPHALYNLGNERLEPLPRLIAIIEDTLGKKARVEYLPMQPGDVQSTIADIGSSRRDLGYDPRTTIDEGIPRFIAWYRDYHGV
ncbi:MAG: SDR family NAD(P)-dependent oxidoreductase [Alphaproteobacteria bacterium]